MRVVAKTALFKRAKSRSTRSSSAPYRVARLVDPALYSLYNANMIVTTGSINLSARQLQVLPAFLFDCHLGFVPDVLKDQASSSQAENISRFGAADLTMIKLRDNAIKSIPSEISYFGALAVLDVRGHPLLRSQTYVIPAAARQPTHLYSGLSM